MSYLYLRDVSFRLGIPGQPGRDLSELRTSFKIEKTSDSKPNQAQITIYNLNKDNRAFVEQEGLFAILEVGYRFEKDGRKPLREVIFQGDVGAGSNELSGSDWLTSFEVGDGQVALQNAKFNKTFSKGLSLSSAIDEVAKSLGKPISVVKGVADKVFKSDLTLSGGAKEILDRLTEDSGLEWSIQDGEVIILPPNESDGQGSVLLSRDSGMIGSPIGREKGIEVTSTLNPKIRPGKAIRIESKYLEGNYRVRKVTHQGDSFEGPWTTRVEAI